MKFNFKFQLAFWGSCNLLNFTFTWPENSAASTDVSLMGWLIFRSSHLIQNSLFRNECRNHILLTGSMIYIRISVHNLMSQKEIGHALKTVQTLFWQTVLAYWPDALPWTRRVYLIGRVIALEVTARLLIGYDRLRAKRKAKRSVKELSRSVVWTRGVKRLVVN